MIIFLKNIPVDTRPQDIEEFVTPGMRVGVFFRVGRLLKAEILVIRDGNTKKIEYHGLIYVDSEKTGERLIKKLNGKEFKNRVVEMRQYYSRCWHNDRRLKHADRYSKNNKEKRLKPRRRIRREKIVQLM